MSDTVSPVTRRSFMEMTTAAAAAKIPAAVVGSAGTWKIVLLGALGALIVVWILRSLLNYDKDPVGKIALRPTAPEGGAS